MHERVLNVFGTAKKGFVGSDIIIIIIKKALRPSAALKKVILLVKRKAFRESKVIPKNLSL